MKGRIYISGAFSTISRSKCGGGKGWLDNDPHFWTQPPTWGICRTDFRRVIREGDYIFFVLPKKSKLPQMVYGYFRIKEKLTHMEAYSRSELRHKRMGKKNPNGNIIVDENGRYNRFDGGVHRSKFEQIQQHYAIGSWQESEFLTEERIMELAAGFVPKLNEIFGTNRDSVVGVIGRKGRRMTATQVHTLLTWLRQP